MRSVRLVRLAMGLMMSGCSTPGIAVGDGAGQSSDWAEMDASGRLFLHREADDGRTVTAAAGERDYRGFLELVPGIEPGRRAPLKRAVAMFARTSAGETKIYDVDRGGGSGEQIVRTLATADRDYGCYDSNLTRFGDDAIHYVLEEQLAAIEACRQTITRADDRASFRL